LFEKLHVELDADLAARVVDDDLIAAGGRDCPKLAVRAETGLEELFFQVPALFVFVVFLVDVDSRFFLLEKHHEEAVVGGELESRALLLERNGVFEGELVEVEDAELVVVAGRQLVLASAYADGLRVEDPVLELVEDLVLLIQQPDLIVALPYHQEVVLEVLQTQDLVLVVVELDLLDLQAVVETPHQDLPALGARGQVQRAVAKVQTKHPLVAFGQRGLQSARQEVPN